MGPRAAFTFVSESSAAVLTFNIALSDRWNNEGSGLRLETLLGEDHRVR